MPWNYKVCEGRMPEMIMWSSIRPGGSDHIGNFSWLTEALEGNQYRRLLFTQTIFYLFQDGFFVKLRNAALDFFLRNEITPMKKVCNGCSQ